MDFGLVDRTQGYRAGRMMKTTAVNLLPPMTLVAVVGFWALAPAELLSRPWLLVVTSAAITAFVQALEWIAERHAGWRIDRREFLTDLFYVVLGSTAIAWATITRAAITRTTVTRATIAARSAIAASAVVRAAFIPPDGRGRGLGFSLLLIVVGPGGLWRNDRKSQHAGSHRRQPSRLR